MHTQHVWGLYKVRSGAVWLLSEAGSWFSERGLFAGVKERGEREGEREREEVRERER